MLCRGVICFEVMIVTVRPKELRRDELAEREKSR